METPAEEVHRLAPENLPPEVTPAPLPQFNKRIFDRARKVAIVAELIESGMTTSQIAAKVSAESNCRVTAPQIRGWSQAYNVEARETLKARSAERLLGPAPPPIDIFEGEHRNVYTPAERRAILAKYHATGLGPEEAAKQIDVPYTTLKKWIAAEGAREKHYAPRKSVAGPGANITEAQREAALEKVIAGAALQTTARALLVSPKSIRNWYLKKFGKPLEARELKRNAMEKAKVKIPTPSKKKAARRFFSESEKILYAVRYKKLKIDNIEQGAKKLGVSPSALREWVRLFDKLKPQAKAAIRIAEHGPISDEVKAQAVAAIEEGQDWAKVAEDVGVHRDSIKNWYLKAGKKWPSPWAARSKSPNVIAQQSPMDARAPDAVAEVEGGKMISEVARELGTASGTIRTWWRAIKGNKKWPNQYGMKADRSKYNKRKGVPYGPQKKTRDRAALVETATGEPAATAPSGGMSGQSVHDAIVFLRMARDECTKMIRAGNMRADDSLMLYTMLALNRLGG